ncbi:DH domain-containing protein [Mycena venus]|uniref:DH domain-containing protein n=1 Tax=Mycena venus TaxID=2733690 RepID=A0A8H6YJT1_9AGAR|nr:DH domain-containing protein [Mycena venus]
MEDVARAVNEGRRRAEVVKEVLTAPKKPPTVLRIKSFRAPADPNSEAARVDRMANELARIDVFAQQLSRTAQEWARAADSSARSLLSWAKAFAAAIGLSASVRSEAFDAFLSTLTENILPAAAGLLPSIASDILAPLAPPPRFRRPTTTAPCKHGRTRPPASSPPHHARLPKEPPPARASLRLCALPCPPHAARGRAPQLPVTAASRARRVSETVGCGAGGVFWRGEGRVGGAVGYVEGGGGSGMVAGRRRRGCGRARWGDVDAGVRSLAICQPLQQRLSLPQGAMTPAEAVARAYTDPLSVPIPMPTANTSMGNGLFGGALGYASGGGMGMGSPESPSPLAYVQSEKTGTGPPSPHYERNKNRASADSSGRNNNRDSSGASVHSSNSSGKAAHVSNVLASLDPSRRGAGVNVSATTAMLGALAPNHGHSSMGSAAGSSMYGGGGSMAGSPPARGYTMDSSYAGSSPPTPGFGSSISGPFPLMPRPRGGSDATLSPTAQVMAIEEAGEGGRGWNEPRALSRSREREGGRGKSPLRNGESRFNANGGMFNGSGSGKNGTVRSKSPTPTTQTARTVKDGHAEFGEVVAEIGWGDYGGMILPPKKMKDAAREEEKAREKERERRRREEEKEAKEREKARKKEEKRAAKEGKDGKASNSNSNSSEPSPRSSLASSRLALLEGAGYGFREKPKPKSKSKQRPVEERDSSMRRASDNTSNSNSNSNRNSNANSSGSKAPSRPPSRGRSVMDELPQITHPYASAYAYPRAAPPAPSDTFKARRSTWLAAPAQYSCRVVHPCTPPAAVSYFGFPFFALEEHALLGVLHEAGHPSTHPRLPLYVDDGEDCLLLCRDAAGEIGWALASFLAPLAAD